MLVLRRQKCVGLRRFSRPSAWTRRHLRDDLRGSLRRPAAARLQSVGQRNCSSFEASRLIGCGWVCSIFCTSAFLRLQRRRDPADPTQQQQLPGRACRLLRCSCSGASAASFVLMFCCIRTVSPSRLAPLARPDVGVHSILMRPGAINHLQSPRKPGNGSTVPAGG